MNIVRVSRLQKLGTTSLSLSKYGSSLLHFSLIKNSIYIIFLFITDDRLCIVLCCCQFSSGTLYINEFSFFVCVSWILNSQKIGNVHRSKSVPDLIKGTQSDSIGGVFRVIPATPHVVGETGAASNSTQPLDAGNSVFKVTLESGYENLQLHSWTMSLSLSLWFLVDTYRMHFTNVV